MLIDWFTVVAQIINFLVLVYLLKRFLFGRITKAMEDREEKITSRLEDANNKKNEAEEQYQLYQNKINEIDSERQRLLHNAKEEAEEEKKKLVNKARAEVEELESRWKEAIGKEKESFIDQLSEKVNEEIFVISRLALKDLANADLEQRMIKLFIDKLRTSDDQDWNEILKSGDMAKKGTIVSSFEIPEGLREEFDKVITQKVCSEIEMEFVTNSDLICGIQLKINGHKISWSIENYIADLEKNISHKLKELKQKDEG